MRWTVYRHESGVWCRQGVAADAYVIGETPTYERLQIVPGDVVLDVGANIGVVARRVLERGAARVIAVEPYSENTELLRLNLSMYDPCRYTVVPAAVVGEDHPTGFANLGVPAENFAMCSLVPHGAPYAVIAKRCNVPALPFDSLLTEHRPTVLKIDIEAGEYALLSSLSHLPRHVRSVAIEWHNFEPHLQDGQFLHDYSETHAAIVTGGFSVVHTSGAMVKHEHSAILHIYERNVI